MTRKLDTAPFNTYMFHVLYNYTVLSKMSGKCLQNTWTYAYESFFHNIQFCICFLYILNNTGKIKLYSHSITTNIHIHCSSNFASDKIIFFLKIHSFTCTFMCLYDMKHPTQCWLRETISYTVYPNQLPVIKLMKDLHRSSSRIRKL